MVVTAAAVCLALTIYGEARGEHLEGQLAVAQVIVNRKLDPRYPDRVCAVTHQPDQFAPATKITDPEAFAKALAISIEVLTDRPPDLTDGATHFFSGPTPYWAPEFSEIGQIGAHTFLKEPMP